MKLFNQRRLAFLFLTFIFLLSSGFRCKCSDMKNKSELKPTELTIWGVVDDSSNFSDFITSYQSVHPNITIKYKKFRAEEYEKMLLEAWAEDRGPDIFAIKNSWLGKYKSKITPPPDKISTVYVYQKEIFANKKEDVYETKDTVIPNLKDLKESYIQAVYDEILLADDSGRLKIYGLPLFVDTLALYYNQDLLNNVGIVSPPKNWEEFIQQISKLTKFNEKGEVIRPAAGIGAGKNIKYGFDILSGLMTQSIAQSGSTMINERGFPIFNQSSPLDKNYNPGETALTFYTDFAQSTKQVYTWNETFPLDIDAFQQNQLTFFFGYNQDLAFIKSGGQKLNFGIAPLPQLNEDKPVNVASFWLQTVSFKSKNADKAWDFILYLSQKDNLKKYLEKTKRPTPLKTFIEEQEKDLELGAFASQLLTAQSWYRGKNYEAARGAFMEMIDNVLKGATVRQAISIGIQKINQTY